MPVSMVPKSTISCVLVPIGRFNSDRLEKGESTGEEQSQASRSLGTGKIY